MDSLQEPVEFVIDEGRLFWDISGAQLLCKELHLSKTPPPGEEVFYCDITCLTTCRENKYLHGKGLDTLHNLLPL